MSPGDDVPHREPTDWSQIPLDLWPRSVEEQDDPAPYDFLNEPFGPHRPHEG